MTVPGAVGQGSRPVPRGSGDGEAMNVVICDRTDEVPADVKAYIEKKLGRVARHLDVVTTAEVEFDQDSKRSQEPIHTVDISLRLLGSDLEGLRAHEQGRVLTAVVDLALDKIDREVVQLKARLKEHP